MLKDVKRLALNFTTELLLELRSSNLVLWFFHYYLFVTASREHMQEKLPRV